MKGLARSWPPPMQTAHTALWRFPGISPRLFSYYMHPKGVHKSQIHKDFEHLLHSIAIAV